MLFVAVLLLPSVVLCVLVVTVLHLVITGSSRPVRAPADGAMIFLCFAALTYFWGSWHKFTGLDVAETCSFSPREGPRGGGFERIDYGAFPPSAECVWANGNTSDLVPDYVAPLLYAFLLAAAACTITAAHLARRNHRKPPQQHDTPA